jgi:hypothetical protein
VEALLDEVADAVMEAVLGERIRLVTERVLREMEAASEAAEAAALQVQAAQKAAAAAAKAAAAAQDTLPVDDDLFAPSSRGVEQDARDGAPLPTPADALDDEALAAAAPHVAALGAVDPEAIR